MAFFDDPLFLQMLDSLSDGIVLLPPATYTIDCKVLNYDAPIEIEF